MKRLLTSLWALFVSRAVTPVIMLCFLLLYIGIAFFNDEPLTTLLAVTRETPPVALLFALIPLNCAVRLVMEGARFLKRRTVMQRCVAGSSVQNLFDESLSLSGNANLAELQLRLESFGYRTSLTGSSLSVWRGISLSPAKMIKLTAICCLFSGILVSTVFRSSQRVAVVEGEPFPHATGGGNRVERITLADNSGLLLQRTLDIAVAGTEGRSRILGIYPPALYHGRFVYSRYLGIAPLIRFSAPDLPRGFETHFILMIYPPGKEDSADIPGSRYRIFFSMATPEAGNEPFQSGRVNLLFRIKKGEEPVASGHLPIGGSYEKDGYQLAFTDFRRVVAVDLVRDYGVYLNWAAALLFIAVAIYWLPVRFFFPRREMLFINVDSGTLACSRAEGGRISHGGVFHEVLDYLDAGRTADRFNEDEDKRFLVQ